MRQCSRKESRRVIQWTEALLGLYWHNIEAKVIAADPMCTQGCSTLYTVDRISRDARPRMGKIV